MILKIQIEPIISTQKSKVFWWMKNDSIIQTKPFELNLRITNIGDEPIRGFTIKNIQFRSAGGQNIIHSVDKSFHINTLNPDASTEIRADKFGTYMHGLAQIDIDLVPDDASNTIETYQKDPFTKGVAKYKFSNKWLDFLYVLSKTEDTQNSTNSLLVFLTYLMVIVIIANLYLFIKFQVLPEI